MECIVQSNDKWFMKIWLLSSAWYIHILLASWKSKFTNVLIYVAKFSVCFRVPIYRMKILIFSGSRRHNGWVFLDFAPIFRVQVVSVLITSVQILYFWNLLKDIREQLQACMFISFFCLSLFHSQSGLFYLLAVGVEGCFCTWPHPRTHRYHTQ